MKTDKTKVRNEVNEQKKKSKHIGKRYDRFFEKPHYRSIAFQENHIDMILYINDTDFIIQNILQLQEKPNNLR